MDKPLFLGGGEKRWLLWSRQLHICNIFFFPLPSDIVFVYNVYFIDMDFVYFNLLLYCTGGTCVAAILTANIFGFFLF